MLCGWAVAERAGVNKTTVYRRWPTKQVLVKDAMRSYAQKRADYPEYRVLARRFNWLSCTRWWRRVLSPLGASLVG